ncbi:NAD(P)-dependent oxidoreductase [Aquibacillus rhizosphaerae]|uniref:NAD(P)-dependent oxidoreductase n=1 Tax=Aquibacillus rhizosphaerae TaxID=3051431 RepID=A0ABT7L719_9BACI|nr:NAD(P)-dependent oxidoreductase [Aquibacillus sp. LR5S19]MDL4841621.1 NAD(P)-dependent oxidoreductase [Aquibacillus sp. LR5S19]
MAGAGLDVFQTEPLEKTNPLWNLDNVIITSHSAGFTKHFNKRVIEDILIPNLKNYQNGNQPAKI